MPNVKRWGSALILTLCAATIVAKKIPHGDAGPIEATRVLALVAGNALPENVIAAIETRGLAFQPSPEFMKELQQAGATNELLQSVNRAPVRTTSSAHDASQETRSRVDIATAGQLIREKNYAEAKKKLTEALRSGGDRLDAGFVMGEVLRQQERWGLSILVYEGILLWDKKYPEANTKLSYVLYRAGNAEASLIAAKKALEITPNNAEAHKNAGLAFESMRKFEAATKEYREALRIKPDYQNVHFDLGILLYNKGDLEEAIAEDKEALLLNPGGINERLNLALAYSQKKDELSAIRVLREAKSLSPGDLLVRERLGIALLTEDLDADAVTELREQEKMDPKSLTSHLNLATALYKMRDYESSKEEYEIAIGLNPAEPKPVQAIGRIYEAQEKYDLALRQYLKAEQMDPNSVQVHLCVARVLLRTSQAAKAIDELQVAKELEPGNAEVHDQLGKTLQALGDFDKAKTEYKESLLLDGQDSFALLDLAGLLEKQGDWAGALEYYQKAARITESALTTRLGPRSNIIDAPTAYKAAKVRFDQHLTNLRATGKGAEAVALEAHIEETKEGHGISGKMDEAMEAGTEAFQAHKFDEAERSYKEAVKLGERLQPHEARLVMSLGYLGSMYFTRKDYPDAQAAFERQLNVAEEVYGPTSPQTIPVLESLTRLALAERKWESAESFAQQELHLSEKNAGTDSMSYSIGLMSVGYVYFTEKKYQEARPCVEKAVKIHEQLVGPQAITLVSSKSILCIIYDSLGQAAESEKCNRDLIKVMEPLYGDNNAALVSPLTREARALRGLGRNAEASEVERRIQALHQVATGSH